MIAYISGHLDLTQEEFDEHYKLKIITARLVGYSFVVGDARGADTMAQRLLSCEHEHDGKDLGFPEVTVYHMFETPRNNVGNFKTIGGFTSDTERDEAMTLNSDYDIAWVKPGRKNSGTAKNIKRREKNAAEYAWILRKTQQRIQKPLSEYHTKELMDFRFSLKRDWWEYEDFQKYGRQEGDLVEPSKPTYTVEELFVELARRPHVPNKKEGKELRRLAAKRKK